MSQSLGSHMSILEVRGREEGMQSCTVLPWSSLQLVAGGRGILWTSPQTSTEAQPDRHEGSGLKWSI